MTDTQKPSEKINEIFKERDYENLHGNKPNPTLSAVNLGCAIMEYLDQQWEEEYSK